MFQRLSSLQLNPIQLTWVAALFFTTIGNVGLWQMLWSNVEINSLHGLLFSSACRFSFLPYQPVAHACFGITVCA
nr:hypothetical protein KXZ65_00395 [Pectobacterium sp. PL152]